MCNMCRLLNDLDFPLLIAHCSLLISGGRILRRRLRQKLFAEAGLSKFELAVVPELTAGMSFLAKTRAVRTL